MEKTGIADLPLHYGKAPAWLYKRMVRLADAISAIIIEEYGEEKLLELLSNPYWFQSFSCVLGYDWHSSGTTTVTCACLKEALSKYGIMAAGGKGMAKRTLEEIEEKAGEIYDKISYASRMTAKVDSAALQDGYELYHHMIIFDSYGRWIVIQQGMDKENRYARRYHWIWKIKNFVEEPHSGIIGKKGIALNMTDKESEEARNVSVDIVKEKPSWVYKQFMKIRSCKLYQSTLDGKMLALRMPEKINWNALREAYEIQPRNFEEMLAIKGIGASTVRALAYISDLIYGCPPSWNDPVKYSFAVGGKDGVPYPVNRKAMDEATNILIQSLEEAKIGKKDKIEAIKKLKIFVE
ncbi:MAG: DUF763 domain-containing protein [Thermoplasmatales archaeon]|nr:DUF763 domain-containing protein [Thermoplasmatales archaeon]